jgi:hypothetical protein
MAEIEPLAPAPWAYETTAIGADHGRGHVYIVDANGRRIASLWGPSATKMATAALILDARNGMTGDG